MAGPGGVDALKQSLMKAAYLAVRLYCRVVRPITLGVKVLALNGEGEVLLIRHSYRDGWHLPGGGVARGETLSEAAARELWEETGVRVPAPDLSFFTAYYHRPDRKHDHVHLFTARLTGPYSLTVDAREIVEAGFFRVDALPEGVTEATRRRLGEVLSGAPRSELW